ncbi:hypothetical protein R6Q57_022259 [Mikania cordata]
MAKHRKHLGESGIAGGNAPPPPYPLRQFYCSIANVDKLWFLIPKDVMESDAQSKSIVVEVKLESKTAEKKIKESGGSVA